MLTAAAAAAAAACGVVGLYKVEDSVALGCDKVKVIG